MINERAQGQADRARERVRGGQVRQQEHRHGQEWEQGRADGGGWGDGGGRRQEGHYDDRGQLVGSPKTHARTHAKAN